MRLVAVICAALTWIAVANPIRVPHIYIASEHLTITLSPREAALSGIFTFRTSSQRAQGARTDLRIPIWIPKRAINHTLAEVLARKPAPDPKLLSAALDVRVIVDGKAQRPSKVYLRDRSPIITEEKEYEVMWIQYVLSTRAARDGVSVNISYRLPSFETENSGRFYYVPYFAWRPLHGRSSRDTNLYSITVRAAQGCEVVMTNLSGPHIIRHGQDIILSPTDRIPIRASIKRLEPDSPVNGSQPIRSETSSTSSAAGTRR